MEWLIVVLLVAICVILIIQARNTGMAIREANKIIAEHLHGISHMVTKIEEGIRTHNLRAESEERMNEDIEHLTVKGQLFGIN